MSLEEKSLLKACINSFIVRPERAACIHSLGNHSHIVSEDVLQSIRLYLLVRFWQRPESQWREPDTMAGARHYGGGQIARRVPILGGRMHEISGHGRQTYA